MLDKKLEQFSLLIRDKMAETTFGNDPNSLYEPIHYLLSLGGKRIRPALALMAYDLYRPDVEQAVPLALALEYFHNFSLMHDDIMDDAKLRRGFHTVNEKYDVNTAILSGDVLLVYCYRLLENYPPELALPLMKHFNKMAIEVCEGQRWDMDFEKMENVSIEQYIKMIEYKTSVLLACCLAMGATAAHASKEDVGHLYEFGKNIGIAFQIQDDILDAFGDETRIGKKAGGDIIQKKKTYLYIKALELTAPDLELKNLYEDNSIGESHKIDQVKNIFVRSGALEYANQLRDVYNDLAISHLHSLSVGEDKKIILKQFAQWLVSREL